MVPNTPPGSSATTFFWHDYETFGRVPRRDRPVQFAGIRTDLELNEIAAPVMLYCQPPTDSLPDPESVLITGILPQHAQQQGVTERDFARAIEAELSASATIGVGYNSIRFDDEVTRHLLWRNLADPYARETSNGCGRWDLIDVVRACWALRPEGIEWPRHTEGEIAGRPSFKLEHLTRTNGIGHEAAHDALSDVRATIALARLIRSRQPRLWDFCLKLHKKDAVWAEIGWAQGPRPFVHLSGRYGVERGSLAVVWPLALHPRYKNELIVWDLAHDPRVLLGLDADAVKRRLFTRQDALDAAGQGEQRLPIKSIHVNKSPVVFGQIKALGDAATRWQIDLEAARANAGHAQALGRHLDGLWSEVFAPPAAAAAVDVDEALYGGGFIKDDDRRTLNRLRALDGDALAAMSPVFHDQRLDELLFRYRARNFPATLTVAERARWHAHRGARLHGGAGGATTLAAFFERIDTLAEDALERGDEGAQALLEALVDWAEGIAPEA